MVYDCRFVMEDLDSVLTCLDNEKKGAEGEDCREWQGTVGKSGGQ